MSVPRKTRQYILSIVLFTLVPLLLVAQQLSVGARGKEAVGSRVMVATAHPLASEAAIAMVQKGGNAVDAAVAAAFAIGVVEPDGSGIGGGGGMLIRLKNGSNIYINYYQQASSRVNENGFVGGRDNQTAKAILIPGTVAGLAFAVKEYGTLPLATVLEPAIRLAEQGFPIDETLSKIILDNVSLLQKHPATASVYLRDGFPLAEGDLIQQKELAKTLRIVAEQGVKGFYSGDVARTIVDEIVSRGGMATLEDFQNCSPTVSEPLLGSYRGYTIISAPPPHSGATVIEALNVLENVGLKKMGYYANSTDAFHLLAETVRRVYADRVATLADPRFEYVPIRGLLSKDFAKSRFADISMAAVNPPEYRQTKAGNPLSYDTVDQKSSLKKTPDQMPEAKRRDNQIDGDSSPSSRRGAKDMSMNIAGLKNKRILNSLNAKTIHAVDDIPFEAAGGHTTHISIMDRDGNMVSLTQTLGTFFGSGVTAAGVLLNNAMSNFAATARVNSIQPNKRPRSSIAPTILLKDEKPFMVVGSPGATRIMATVITLIVNAVDYGLDAAATNRAPRFLCQRSDDALSLESRFTPEVQEGMKKKGHKLQLYGDYDLFFGGAQIILVDPSGIMHGVADPRRGGTAMGY
ncbi:MAG: gamma-glutamyltransferase family protein [bacterium]